MERGVLAVLSSFKSFGKTICLQHSRADTKCATHAVLHGAPPEIPDGRSLMERGAAKGCSAGIPKSLPSDERQPLPASTSSTLPKNRESTLVLGDDM